MFYGAIIYFHFGAYRSYYFTKPGDVVMSDRA